MASELQKLLECLSNQQSMDIIFDATNTLIDDANKDDSGNGSRAPTCTWARCVVRYYPPLLQFLPIGLSCSKQATSLRLEPDCKNRVNQIHDYNGKFKAHFHNLLSVGDPFNAMGMILPIVNLARIGRKFVR